GDFLWKTYFNGEFDGDDEGTGITADANGNIFVSGESQITDSTYQKVTIKYRTDYFLVPQDTVPTPSSLLFYPNWGQIIDTEDSVRKDVYFYTINQYPKLYFQQDTIDFVFAKVDTVTATTDTLERIAMNFADGMLSDPYYSEDDLQDTDQVLNYFLGHCPDGITGVKGTERLMYGNVYKNTDVIFANNNAGMKFQIIMNPGAEPQAVLHFTGQQSLQLVNTADLQINGLLGSFTYERPLVYQLEEDGSRTSLGWLASYYIDGDDVSFILPGSYDHHKPLVVECAREQLQTNSTCIDNLCYSTYLGGQGDEVSVAIVADASGNVFIAGYATSSTLPFLTGFNQVAGTYDATVFKMIGSTGEIKWGGFYGGSEGDFAEGIDVDDQGDVYVQGYTYSDNFIDAGDVTINPNHDPGYYGGELHGANTCDAFIIKLDGSSGPNGGTIVWGNYLGSTNNDQYGSLSVDKTGDNSIYVAGTTYGNDFPILSFTGAYNQSASNGDAEGYIMKFDQSGTLIWSSYFGSDAIDRITDIKVARDGTLFPLAPVLRIYISGGSSKTTFDATTCAPPTSGGFPNCASGGATQFPNNGYNGFIAEFNSVLALHWTTFITSNSFANPEANSLAAHDNVVYLKLSHTANNSTGFPSFPTCTGCYRQIAGDDDGYIARFDDDVFTWATFWGGDGADLINGIYTNGSELFITGRSTTQTYQSANFCSVPTSGEYPLCHQPSFYYVPNINTASIQVADAFIAAFNSNNELIWSTYIGGNNDDVGYAFASTGNYLFLVGSTSSYFATTSLENYPLVTLPSPGYNQPAPLTSTIDGFLSRFDVGLHIGIDELSENNQNIIAYPNPFTGKVTFKFSIDHLSDLSYSIKNIVGQIVISEKIKLSAQNSFSIDMTGYSPGIYFASIISKDKIAIVKIIKQ
ncbi:MAG: T9SS type A sorting domain-containing protein, partial [Bacteroidota bacterium]